MEKSTKKFSILSCSVFKSELDFYIKDLENKPESISFFELGLHQNPELMKNELQGLLDSIALKDGVDSILLLAGLCGMAIVSIEARYCDIIIPRMHDCISMFLGSAEKYEKLKKEKSRAYFASCGWVDGGLLPSKELYEKHLTEYKEKYPDDEELVEDLMEAFAEQFKEYNSYLYTEFLESKENKAKCLEFSKFMNWQFESIKGDDNFFRDAINLNLDDRFLYLKKGEKIKASFDNKIIEAI